VPSLIACPAAAQIDDKLAFVPSQGLEDVVEPLLAKFAVWEQKRGDDNLARIN
jgi:hypothetical protein